jgi:hypothetical protein
MFFSIFLETLIMKYKGTLLELSTRDGRIPGGLIGPVRGISDGKVGISDLGLVSAYWDNPKGPSHP